MPQSLNNTTSKKGYQSPLQRGVQASGGLGSAFSSLVQLPGAMMGAFKAQSNAQNANRALSQVAPQQAVAPFSVGKANSPSTPNASMASSMSTPKKGFNITEQPGLASVAPAGFSPQASKPTIPSGFPDVGSAGPTQGVLAAPGMEYGPDGQLQAKQGLFPSVVGSLAGMSNVPSAQFQSARQDYDAAADELKQLQSEAAGNRLVGARTSMADYAGTQGILSGIVSQRQDAITNRMNAALNAQGVATAQQGTQQSGLAAAGGLAQPQPYGITNVPFSPAEGNFGGIAGAQGGNIGAAGEVTGNLGLSQNYFGTMVPAFNQAQSVYQGLQGFMQDNPDLNPSSANFVNFAKAWALGKQLSDSRYPQFNQYLNELLQTLVPIVGTQGMTDYKTQLVQTMVDPRASGESIMKQVENLMQIAKGKLDATQQTFSQPQGGGGGMTFGSFF